MKLYNPTPEIIPCCDSGFNYWVHPNSSISVTEEIGKRILKKWHGYGLFNMEIPNSVNKAGIKNFLLTAIAEGLNRYLEHLNRAMNGYLTFDGELKQQNQYSTILNSKNAKRLGQKIKVAVSMLKDFEAKYNIVIKDTEVEHKTETLMNSVDSLLKEYEENKEKQEQALSHEKEVDELLQNIMKPKKDDVVEVH